MNKSAIDRSMHPNHNKIVAGMIFLLLKFTTELKTAKMKKVLIALDYDPTAQKVAETGYSFAKDMGAKVVLMHVVADPIFYNSLDHVNVIGFAGNTDIAPLQLNTSDELKQSSQKFLDKSKQHLADDSIKTIVKEGEFADAILKTADEVKADVIVMGSHNHRWLDEVLAASITEKVLRHTNIPLFIVPTKQGK
jgi:nucleotide-binding universal stress UspA family protein